MICVHVVSKAIAYIEKGSVLIFFKFLVKYPSKLLSILHLVAYLKYFLFSLIVEMKSSPLNFSTGIYLVQLKILDVTLIILRGVI